MPVDKVIAEQREQDAALFEDWSAWPGLVVLQDYRPMPMLELRPRGGPAADLVRKLPGVRAYRQHRYNDVCCYHVPMVHWRAVRAALPAIAAADDAYKAERSAETARLADVEKERRRSATDRYICPVDALPAVGDVVVGDGRRMAVEGTGKHWQQHNGPWVCYVYTRPLAP